MAKKEETFQTVSNGLINFTGPIIKNVSFNPKPVAGIIPLFADSLRNPNCYGTPNHREWWEEQFYYMQNGYTTAGTFIPGVYYQYLNYQKITGLMGRQYPDYTDTHYRLYRLVYEIKKYKVPGILIPKARRKGISWFGESLVNNGMRFIEDYRFGVAGGLDTYVRGFQNKLYTTYNDVPPEMRVGHLLRNKTEFKLGWEEAGTVGSEEFATAIGSFKTMKDDATKLEGEYFHDVIGEESGAFDKVEEFVTSLLPTMDVGSYTFGTMYLWGTGGDTMKQSKGFKNLWHAAEALGFVKFPILGNQYYFPYYVGAKEKDGTIPQETKNLTKSLLDQGLQPEQILGCEDPVAAEKEIREERARLAKNPNKKFLVQWNQKYPLTVEEIFTSSGSNNFNTDKLYGQAYQIESTNSKIQQVVLEWVKDERGNIVMPLKVKYRPATDKDRDWMIVDMLRPPMPEIKNLDIGGIDGYNEDITTTSKSLGAMNIHRRFKDFHIASELQEEIPLHGTPIICQYYKRPPRKEAFFEICLQLSVLYNLLKNTMISAESDMVIQYYKNQGCSKYLSPRPKSFDAPNGELHHDFGAKMTPYSKPRMIGLLQTWVEDDTESNWYLRTVQDLISYDDQNIGTDYDSADASGLVLMRIEDMRAKPQARDDEALNEAYELPSFKLGSDGVYQEDNEYERMIRDMFGPR